MASKHKTKPVQDIKKTAGSETVAQPSRPKFQISAFDFPVPPSMAWLYDFKIQSIIICTLAFVFYFNSFFNEYAHDDGIVIVKNEYVQEGFAGIPKILTRDAYDSYYRQLNTTNQ